MTHINKPMTPPATTMESCWAAVPWLTVSLFPSDEGVRRRGRPCPAGISLLSPELKAILEKAALMQADRQRTGGMSSSKRTLRGQGSDLRHALPGVFLVSTASHGGTMVAKEVAAVLSTAAKKCGFQRNGYICFEEDAQESVVLRELLDKKLWKIPDRIKDKEKFEENINQSIRQYNPDYWRARQAGREAAVEGKRPLPAKETAR
mgnify:CR=1 FL=1